jgi:PTH2 family peptidyl-tRNA hydrolase
MSSVTEQLIAMGIDQDLAAGAATATGDVSCEAAMALLFEDRAGGADSAGGGVEEAAAGPVLHAGGSLKQVIVVNASLGMSVGKIAAQCCHASLAAYKETVRRGHGLEKAWGAAGEPTIVLQVENAEKLEQLNRAAKQGGVVACTVRDAGRTQVAAGSMTCCAIGPDRLAAIDAITGQLKLL